MAKINDEPIVNKEEWRYEFAGRAMSGIIAKTGSWASDLVAKDSVGLADALLAELSKGEK